MSAAWQWQEGFDTGANSNGSDPISRRVQAREIVARAWQQSLAELVAQGQQSLEWQELWRQHNEYQQDPDPFKSSLESLMKFVLTVRERFMDEPWFQAAGDELGLWDEASQKALAEVKKQKALQAERMRAEEEQKKKEEAERRAKEEAEAAARVAEAQAAEEAAAKQAAEKQAALQHMAAQLQALEQQAIAAQAAKVAEAQAQSLAEAQAQAEQAQALQQIALQKQIMDEAEKAAKTAAAQHGGFVGLFARFDEKKGFGFIECAESKAVHGRDIFLLKSLRADAEPGDIVSFEVEQGEKGLPQARGVKVLRELSQHRRLIMTWQQVYTGAIVTPAPTGKRFREEEFPIDTTQLQERAKQFYGVVNKYDHEKGYGFLDCPETYALYNRSVFIHKAQWVQGLQLGDVVSFKVELNDKGWPQARDVIRNEELTERRRQETAAQAAAQAAASAYQQSAAQTSAQVLNSLSAAMAQLQGTAAGAPGLPVPMPALGIAMPVPQANFQDFYAVPASGGIGNPPLLVQSQGNSAGGALGPPLPPAAAGAAFGKKPRTDIT